MDSPKLYIFVFNSDDLSLATGHTDLLKTYKALTKRLKKDKLKYISDTVYIGEHFDLKKLEQDFPWVASCLKQLIILDISEKDFKMLYST